jgi:hypothetical protein
MEMSRTTIKLRLAILAVPPFFLLGMLLDFAGFLGHLPSGAEVAREFERQHSGWRVVDVTFGGGDEDGRVYGILYRKPPDAETHETHWNVHCSGVMFGWKYFEDPNLSSEGPPKPRESTAAGFLGVATLALSAGLLIGAVGGTYHERRVRFKREQTCIAPVLAKDPGFNRIYTYMNPGDGAAYLYGLVDAEDLCARLDIRMRELFGDSLDEARMRGVSARERPKVSTP